ncbi:mucin-2, partial [Biomphalaria pfeifferi]
TPNTSKPNSTPTTTIINDKVFTTSATSTKLSTSILPRLTTDEIQGNFTREINYESSTIETNFTIKFNENFTHELNNRNSDKFKTAAAKYQEMLSKPFELLPNFDSIEIIQFTPGSINVESRVKMHVFNSTKMINESLIGASLEDIKKEIMGLPDVDNTYLQDHFDEQITAAVQVVSRVVRNPCLATNICSSYTTCDQTEDGTQCRPKYKSEGQPKQSEGGALLTSDAIIGISVGASVGVILTGAIIVLLVLKFKKRRYEKSNSSETDSEEPGGSLSGRILATESTVLSIPRPKLINSSRVHPEDLDARNSYPLEQISGQQRVRKNWRRISSSWDIGQFLPVDEKGKRQVPLAFSGGSLD